MMLCVYFGLLLVLYMFACRVKNKESHFFFAKSARENKHLSGIIMKIISNVSSRTKNPYELMRKDRKKLLCFSGCFFFVLRFNEAIRTITQKKLEQKIIRSLFICRIHISHPSFPKASHFKHTYNSGTATNTRKQEMRLSCHKTRFNGNKLKCENYERRHRWRCYQRKAH